MTTRTLSLHPPRELEIFGSYENFLCATLENFLWTPMAKCKFQQDLFSRLLNPLQSFSSSNKESEGVIFRSQHLQFSKFNCNINGCISIKGPRSYLTGLCKLRTTVLYGVFGLFFIFFKYTLLYFCGVENSNYADP